MKIEVYAMPNRALESKEIVGYSFDVIMSHEDGKKTPLGDYTITYKNKITGSIDYEDEDGMVSLNRIKDIIIGTGLDEIIAGAMKPEEYFWSKKISFPPTCDLTGSFERAAALYNSDKVKRTTSRDYRTMMEVSDMLDREPEQDVRPYDGIYGSDEYDFDEMPYADDDDMDNKSFK